MSYVYELGGMKARCILSKKYGECGGNCKSCERYGRLQRCYDALDDYEKMAVDDTAKFRFAKMDEVYRIDRSNRRWETFKKAVLGGIILWIVVSVAKCSLKDVEIALPVAESPSPVIEEESDRIWETLKLTREEVRDANGDDKINCIDYAVIFKKEWDKRYPPSDCEIVRNNNKAKEWHHLFVRCMKDGEWLCIEPQSDTRLYELSSYWPDEYDESLNIYGETEHWLAKGSYEKH